MNCGDLRAAAAGRRSEMAQQHFLARGRHAERGTHRIDLPAKKTLFIPCYASEPELRPEIACSWIYLLQQPFPMAPRMPRHTEAMHFEFSCKTDPSTCQVVTSAQILSLARALAPCA